MFTNVTRGINREPQYKYAGDKPFVPRAIRWYRWFASLLLWCLVSGAPMRTVGSRSIVSPSGFDGDPMGSSSLTTIQKRLASSDEQVGSHSAVIYTVANPQGITLVMASARGQTTHLLIRVDRETLVSTARQLLSDVSDPSKIGRSEYLEAARQLYDWLVRPLESALTAQQIDTLMFQIDPSLPAIPVSLLHDGDRFLVERYTLSLVPSLSLAETPYRPLPQPRVLVMGASQFTDRPALPSVPLELRTIAEIVEAEAFFLNETFTFENFSNLRHQLNPDIVHLATHAEFKPGAPQESYIQFWDGAVTLDRLRQLDFDRIELLVLSACETAFGTATAELGFAGLAHTLGAKSVLASQWRASDAAASTLAIEFYQQLRDPNVLTKAEALQQAQLAMLYDRVPNRDHSESGSLSHPYFWGTFTLVGSPW